MITSSGLTGHRETCCTSTNNNQLRGARIPPPLKEHALFFQKKKKLYLLSIAFVVDIVEKRIVRVHLSRILAGTAAKCMRVWLADNTHCKIFPLASLLSSMRDGGNSTRAIHYLYNVSFKYRNLPPDSFDWNLSRRDKLFFLFFFIVIVVVVAVVFCTREDACVLLLIFSPRARCECFRRGGGVSRSLDVFVARSPDKPSALSSSCLCCVGSGNLVEVLEATAFKDCAWRSLSPPPPPSCFCFSFFFFFLFRFFFTSLSLSLSCCCCATQSPTIKGACSRK